MTEFNNQIFAEMLMGIIGKELSFELNKEKSKTKALRQALLYLIYLSQDRCPPSCQEFIQYLLTDFPALKERKGQFMYPFLYGEEIKNAVLEDGSQHVVLREKFFEKISELIDSEQLKGDKLPRTFLDRIKTYVEGRDSQED